MTDQELVCLTGPNTQVSWYYQLAARSIRQQLVASTNTEGVSAFSTQVATKQGYFSCDIVNNGSSRKLYCWCVWCRQERQVRILSKVQLNNSCLISNFPLEISKWSIIQLHSRDRQAGYLGAVWS